MSFRILTRSLCSAGIVMLARAAFAADAKPADPDLPQPLDPAVGDSLLQSSPFTRAINLSESLKLTGIAYVEGKAVATLTDRTTKKQYLVTETPNEQGWKLAEAVSSPELRSASVKVLIGGEAVTIHFGDAQLSPTQAAKYPTDAEAIRNDENGKPYVRGSAYLPEADREKYYRGWSREAHDEFRNLIRDHREQMFKYSPEERAEFAKKVFDSIDAKERAKEKK